MCPFPTGNHVETPELEDFIYILTAGLLAQSSSVSGSTSIIAIALTDLLSAGAAKKTHQQSLYILYAHRKKASDCMSSNMYCYEGNKRLINTKQKPKPILTQHYKFTMNYVNTTL